MTSASPTLVTVVPDGWWEANKEQVTFGIAFVTMVATVIIPFVLLWFGNKQEQQKQQRAAQQRLQGHVSQLSDAGGTAIGVISNFKDDCESLGLSYADVFKNRGLIPGQTAEATRQQLHEVDQARRRLQGIWDNIVDDYRADLLGGPVTDPRHSRILRRGLTYMELVEPLEAANLTRLQTYNERVRAEGPYVRPDDTLCNPTPINPFPQPSLMAAAIVCRPRVRPGRFRWLENQETVHLTGKELWQVPQGAKEYHMNAAAAVALQEQGASADNQVWRQALVDRWTVLKLVCATPAAPAAVGAVPAAAAAAAAGASLAAAAAAAPAPAAPAAGAPVAPAAGTAPAAGVVGQPLQVVVTSPTAP